MKFHHFEYLQPSYTGSDLLYFFRAGFYYFVGWSFLQCVGYRPGNPVRCVVDDYGTLIHVPA